MLGQSGGGQCYRDMGEITIQRRNLLKVPVIGSFTLHVKKVQYRRAGHKYSDDVHETHIR